MRARDLFFGFLRILRAHFGEFLMLVIPLSVLSFGISLALEEISREQLRVSIENPSQMDLTGMSQLLMASLLSMFLTSVVAVLWHRRALLNAHVHWSVSGVINGRNFAYFGWSILISMIIVLIISTGIAVVLGIAALFAMIMPLSLFMLISLPAGIAFLAFVYTILIRLSLKLPASAIRRPLSFGPAFHATKNQFWMLLRFGFLLFLAFAALLLPLFDLLRRQISFAFAARDQAAPINQHSTEEIVDFLSPNLFEMAYSAVFGAVFAVFTVGVLTMLYARFVGSDAAVDDIFWHKP